MPVMLQIVMSEEGRVGVTGPLENVVLCYGLLEMARQAIYENKKALDAKIQPAGALAIAQFGKSGN